MRILIASDIHGALDSAIFIKEKALSLKPDICLLLGDYLYHGPRNPLPISYTPQDVAEKLNELQDITNLLAVRGNCDALVDENLLSFPLEEEIHLEIDGLSILAKHGHQYGRQPTFSWEKDNTIMLTGHLHVPHAEKRGHVYWWNPGSISLPKENSARSYGFYENGNFTVLDMEDKVILSHKP